MKRWVIRALCCSIFLMTVVVAGNSKAEPVPQNFQIRTGWNAIFLEVEPADPDPAVVFGPILTDLIGVWMWNPQAGTVEFAVNPTEPATRENNMVFYDPHYVPVPDGPPDLTNLFAIHGNSGYLVNYGGGDTSLTISGEPLPPKANWKANSFNFVGFHFDPDATTLPFFSTFFESSPAHTGQDYYVLNDSGDWVKKPAIQMKAGEAFWIYCKGSSEFTGPVNLQLTAGTKLDYAEILEKQDITLKNDSDVTRTILLSVVDGLPDYPLYYWKLDLNSNIATWVMMPTGPDSYDITLEAGQSKTITLGVKRQGKTEGIVYTRNLQVSSVDDSFFKVPVSFTGISYRGLWVGDVMINKVNEPARLTDPDVLRPTGSTFSYRLLIHYDDAGVARLLNEVIQLLDSDSGSYVLLADGKLVGPYSGAALRDGQPVGRRISSPAYGNFYTVDVAQGDPSSYVKTSFETLTPASGNFAEQGGVLSATLFLPKEDPSNPFVHKYHPKHLPEAGSDITRNLTLTFSDVDSDGNSLIGSESLGWGITELGGIYHESITGLLRSDQTLHMEGPFILHRVSSIDTLVTTAP